MTGDVASWQVNIIVTIIYVCNPLNSPLAILPSSFKLFILTQQHLCCKSTFPIISEPTFIYCCILVTHPFSFSSLLGPHHCSIQSTCQCPLVRFKWWTLNPRLNVKYLWICALQCWLWRFSKIDQAYLICQQHIPLHWLCSSFSYTQQTVKPIKPFVYYHFYDYLASLLSHSDLEFMMDKSCDEFMSTVNNKSPAFVRDIWDAEFLRAFKGPEPHHLFVDRGNEGQYLFTININFFNIEGMHVQGASTFCGLISMVCLNLLPKIWYKPEKHVCCFCESWKKGVHYCCTALHLNGQITCSAIAVAVMDLKAAWGTTGLGQNNHNCHCSVCQCCGKATLGSTDHENWLPQDCVERSEERRVGKEC